MIGLSLMLAFVIAGMTYSPQFSSPANTTGAYTFFQTTSTPLPQEEDHSEVGSTDGIVLMGGVIALIIILPIMAKYKAWAKTG